MEPSSGNLKAVMENQRMIIAVFNRFPNQIGTFFGATPFGLFPIILYPTAGHELIILAWSI